MHKLKKATEQIMAESGVNGQPMEQDPSSMAAGLPPPVSYVTPEHFTSLKYFQVRKFSEFEVICDDIFKYLPSIDGNLLGVIIIAKCLTSMHVGL